LRERQIRAALVYKLTRFVTWPDDALPARGPFVFCYISDDPAASVLAGIEGRAIQNHRTRMRRLTAPGPEAVADCNLLYLADGATLSQDTRSAMKASATLIVADGPRAGPDASMVQLVPRDNRVTLVVDLDRVRAARLRIDATLLQLVEIQP
jgi:hypothetical protein